MRMDRRHQNTLHSLRRKNFVKNFVKQFPLGESLNKP